MKVKSRYHCSSARLAQQDSAEQKGNSSTFVEICLCIPNHFLKRVSVNCKQPISLLNSLFPNEEKVYIFNGQILSQNKTFEQYDFGNFEYVVALTSSSTEDNNNINDFTESSHNYKRSPDFDFDKYKWIQMTKDAENFAEKVSAAASRISSREFARLRDLRLIKLEQKRSFWSKKCSRFISSSYPSASFSQKNIPLVIDFKQYESPRSEAMPFLWNNC